MTTGKIQTQLKLSSVKGMKEYLTGVFDFSAVVHGTRGDLTIINLQAPVFPDGSTIDIYEYINYFLPLEKIEVVGRYTNIYFHRSFFTNVVKGIVCN